MYASIPSIDEELLVIDTVRWWAADRFPAVPIVADLAVNVALRALAGGASASEACLEARRFLDGCGRHPSTSDARRPLSIA